MATTTTTPFTRSSQPRKPKAERSPITPFSAGQIEKITELLESGTTPDELAVQFGIKPASLRYALEISGYKLVVLPRFERYLVPTEGPRRMARVRKSHPKPRGRRFKLSAEQQSELVRLHGTGEFSVGQLATRYSVGRTTIYKLLRMTT